MKNTFDVEKVTEYRKQGLSWKKIAKEMGCSYYALRNWKSLIWFQDPLHHTKASEALNVDEITELRKLGKTWDKIALLQGVSKKTLQDWKKEIGFVDPVIKARSNYVDYQMQEEYENGVTIPDLMKKYNKSYQSIYNVVYRCKPLDEQVKGADHGKAIALLKAGWTVKDTANELHVSSNAILAIVKMAMKRKESGHEKF